MAEPRRLATESPSPSASWLGRRDVKNRIDVVELISVMRGLKPVTLQSIEKGFLPQLESFCSSHGLSCATAEPVAAGETGPIVKQGSCRVVISRAREMAEELLLCSVGMLERKGELLGYPGCCVKKWCSFVCETRDDSFDRYIFSSLGRSPAFPFCTNNAFNFASRLQQRHQPLLSALAERNRAAAFNAFLGNLANLHLISHVPCSYACERSMEQGKAVFDAVSAADSGMAAELRKLLSRPVLFFGDFRFLVFSGIADSNSIAYTALSEPHSLLDAGLVAKFSAGDSVSVDSKEIKVFKSGRLLHAIPKVHEDDGIILPFGP